MSKETFGEQFNKHDEMYREAVMQDTWGHLAPKKNKIYKGRVVFAIGCYDSGDLNPTPLTSDFEDLSSSPWFYDALHDFLRNLPEKYRETGCVYEWVGTFKNYQLEGKINTIFSS
jgi:hypothetical protein